ncbi:alkanesulfonate monooxygenase SsuD/methylene tetrahydromethanopterin reductase-like flavin-dependent oxidoreductase (luciferase family) [Rhizobium sp. PP-F2F-G48]|uniref:LLM class flavin-dependent oxidoreductase n=1 Tax=Rhizobium sp. PP-F2F-G48 TaxID=2135651 RepID=UPI00104DCB03|nr:LLM class flavin-dependent oxidoreductase [Rhizobium sp. PP-F2F-G48]TCM52787.1 alkanesulfonate monooxygenase SsuD/methylene tetrahydromethanopterin reductase-like flavin-dependent oxidoreductase (luciferase family) [Rhizobium sp. PP-F2F-G48]
MTAAPAPTLAEDPAPVSKGTFRPKTRIGFNTRVAFNDEAGPAQGMRDGIALYMAAERLGYQSGWVYQRHFDHYLSSPLPFFAAAGQHARRITFGSAVIPMRYQDPILLAEAAGTTDLLLDGRLELAIATGANAAFDAVFGTVGSDARTEAKRRQARFLAAVRGEVLHTVAGPGEGAPEGTALRVTPHSPTLAARIRQGSASLASAVQAADLGIGLVCGTVQHDHEAGETFGAYQARGIAAFRARWRALWGTEPPPVTVAASVLASTAPDRLETYAAYDAERRTLGIAASRPRGALTPVAAQPPGTQISPVFHGTPDRVIAAILADPGLSAADEIILFLPPGFGLAENTRVLTDFAATVAPSLGWSPSW